MLKRDGYFRARLTRALAALVLALMALRGGGLQAQIPITTNSLSQLKIALLVGGTIQLRFNGTITTTSPLVITANTVLDATGFNVTISGGGSTRIFDVPTNISLTVNNVVISGGRNVGTSGTAGTSGTSGPNLGTSGGNGGSGTSGLGGAIRNQGTTALINCLLVTNTATGGNGGSGGNGGNGGNQAGNGGNGGTGGGGLGGAIYNTGTLVLNNCTLAGNQALGGFGGPGGTNGIGPFASSGAGGAGGLATGGALYNLGTATFVNCTINQNLASGADSQPGGGPPQGNGDGAVGAAGGFGQGGGIFSQGGISFVNCTFFANNAEGGAGGTGGNTTSTLGHGGRGGGGGSGSGGSLQNAGAGTLNLTNCTFANDAATGGAGGAPGTGLFAGQSGAPGASLGASVANSGTTLALHNSILAYPTNGTLASGTITDQGNNLSSDGTPTFTTTNSFINRDPLLVLPLGDNSGPTLTIALYPNSPAVDSVYDGSAPTTDQRLLARPVGARSDAGAFEFGATPTNFSLSGFVLLGGNALPGVTVTAGSKSAVSAANGAYSMALGTGSYTVTPQPSALFSPNSVLVDLSTNVGGVNFTAANAAASIAHVMTNSASVQMTFTGISSLSYRIQTSTNLVAWTDVTTTNSGASGVFSYTTGITNSQARFFRAVTP